jgi:hypothetical protein
VEPSIEEKIKDDESKLYAEIEEMNKNYKSQTKFTKEKPRDLEEDEEEDHLGACDVFANKKFSKRSYSVNYEEEGSPQRTNSFCSSAFVDKLESLKISPDLSKNCTASTGEVSQNDAFVSQNLRKHDDILKLIVLGDKTVGKSLFISKITNENCQESYMPTERY